jgi:hypothetical protein
MALGVWVWEAGKFTLYHLRSDSHSERYEQVGSSELLPDFDTGLLASYVNPEEQFDAVMAFRDQLRAN